MHWLPMMCLLGLNLSLCLSLNLGLGLGTHQGQGASDIRIEPMVRDIEGEGVLRQLGRGVVMLVLGGNIRHARLARLARSAKLLGGEGPGGYYTGLMRRRMQAQPGTPVLTTRTWMQDRQLGSLGAQMHVRMYSRGGGEIESWR